MKNYLTLEDITKSMKVSEGAIYKWINEKRFPKPLKMGRLSRWEESAVNEAIEKMQH